MTATLRPTLGVTHRITVPGRRFVCYLNADFTDPQALAERIRKAGGRRTLPPVVEPLSSSQREILAAVTPERSPK